MDPAETPLGRMLLDEITPVVMVLSTPIVEEACLKNNLSFLQMLTPFCSFSNIDGDTSNSLIALTFWLVNFWVVMKILVFMCCSACENSQ